MPTDPAVQSAGRVVPPGHVDLSLAMSDGPRGCFVRADAIMAITPVDESTTQTELWISPTTAWIANADVETVGSMVAAALSGEKGSGVTRETPLLSRDELEDLHKVHILAIEGRTLDQDLYNLTRRASDALSKLEASLG